MLFPNFLYKSNFNSCICDLIESYCDCRSLISTFREDFSASSFDSSWSFENSTNIWPIWNLENKTNQYGYFPKFSLTLQEYSYKISIVRNVVAIETKSMASCSKSLSILHPMKTKTKDYHSSVKLDFAVEIRLKFSLGKFQMLISF